MHVTASPASATSTIGLNGSLTDSSGATIGSTNFAVSGIHVTPRVIGDILGTGTPNVGSAVKVLRVVVTLDSPPSGDNLWIWTVTPAEQSTS